MKRATAFLLLTLFFPSLAGAKTVGFAGVTLWYSREPVFAGVPVRVYSALINSGEGDLIGTVEFLDNSTVIAKVPVTVLSGGRIREVWTDWTPSLGDHTVSARLVDAKVQVVGKDPVSVEPSFGATSVDSRFFDLDTDGDGVGNREDLDDDGDGFPDERESSLGTDPLNKKEFPSVAQLRDSSPESVTSSPELKENLEGIKDALVAKDIPRAAAETKEAVNAADGALSVWRNTTHAHISRKLAEAENKQANPTTKTPLGYLAVAGLWATQKVLSSQISLYVFVLAVVMLIVRFIRRRRNQIYY